mmetsp:Transcript_19975/g.40895  ORF Transcript_19975/g.40895 Transcript_19975/m.40895 type:complete len:346 (-) Transcript_19975:99-1136(-)
MRTAGIVLLFLQLTARACAFAPVVREPFGRGLATTVTKNNNDNKFSLVGRPASRSGDAGGDNNNNVDARVTRLKRELLERIATLKQYQNEDGEIAVDFGVKGGEIEKKSRVPRKLDFYTVSERVGKAADAILESVEELSELNPTVAATAGMGDKNYGNDGGGGGNDEITAPPLDGPWSLLFSTAADVSFSKDSKRGAARSKNIVDARRGKMTNVIEFAPAVDEEGNETPKAVNELRVSLKATAEGPNRVDLVFKYIAVKFTRFFFLPIRWTLYLPIPGPLIGKTLIGLSNLKNRLLRRTEETSDLPKAFFDVVFLDRELRVHRTGEDNLFVQARPDWETAWEIAG